MSWVIRKKQTGETVFEAANKDLIDAINGLVEVAPKQYELSAPTKQTSKNETEPPFH